MSQGRPADDLSHFCCQNLDCPDYGKRGHGNLTVPMRYGTHGRRLLRCRTCKARFSERKGTPLFDARLPEQKVVALLHHVAEGVGVRKTSRPGRREQRHRGPLQRSSRGPRPATPRRTRGFFPLRPVKASSTRSGPSSARRRSTATAATPRTTVAVITGTTWPSTRNTAWS
jgi:hypothetical protein